MSREEVVTIVNEHNRVVGSATRGEMRARGLCHRATYILVFNKKGELFVQKRTLTKDIYPGYYDVITGGVVLAWEEYEESALRELGEELGIKGIPLKTLFDFFYQGANSRVWGRAFSCEYEGVLVLQEEEIESGAFLSIEDIFKIADKKPFTPDGLYVLKRYLSQPSLQPPGPRAR